MTATELRTEIQKQYKYGRLNAREAEKTGDRVAINYWEGYADSLLHVMGSDVLLRLKKEEERAA